MFRDTALTRKNAQHFHNNLQGICRISAFNELQAGKSERSGADRRKSTLKHYIP